VLGVERIERELGGVEISGAVQLRVEISQQTSEAFEVVGRGRRDDVEILRRTRR